MIAVTLIPIVLLSVYLSLVWYERRKFILPNNFVNTCSYILRDIITTKELFSAVTKKIFL